MLNVLCYVSLCLGLCAEDILCVLSHSDLLRHGQTVVTCNTEHLQNVLEPSTSRGYAVDVTGP